jgi:hypothetical protein
MKYSLAAQPVAGFTTALQRGRGEQDKEVCAGNDVFQYDALEVAASNAQIVEEHVISVLCQVLEDCQRPGRVAAAIADKNGFLGASHNPRAELFA